MPKITHNSFVDLTAFRQKNGLLQQDVANYLEVSRGYVSMVEKGASKLSRKNLDKLYEAQTTKHWDLSDLVPAYTRLLAAETYLNNERNEQRQASGLNVCLFGSDPEVCEKIRYGEIGISHNIDFIRIWCENAPELNLEWLVSGKGEMISKASNEDDKSEIDYLKDELKELKDTVSRLEEKTTKALEELADKILAALNVKN